jgi:hypothetical protein
VDVEDCVTIGEDAEYLSCELDIAATAGKGEDFEAGACCRFEVIWDDLSLPG